MRLLVVIALTAIISGCSASTQTPLASESLVARGQYLVTIMDCGGCHTPGALAGKPDANRKLAGSMIGFAFPGGVIYPPNLSSDPETGLGKWSDAEITRALRQGQSRDGRALVPIMPWPSYAILAEADTRAIVAYLRTVPPVQQAIPRPVPPGQRPPAPYLGVIEPK